MGIAAKELAKKLNLSDAVSMALHDQPGVSTETRKRVKLAAGKYGYDLSRIQNRKAQGGSIDFLVYKKSGAVVGFDNLPSGEVIDPPLTTINVPKRALGKEAVLRLVRRIENPNLPINRVGGGD